MDHDSWLYFHKKLVYLSERKCELNIQGASLNLKKRNFVTILVTIALKNGVICHYSLLKVARLRESRHFWVYSDRFAMR